MINELLKTNRIIVFLGANGSGKSRLLKSYVNTKNNAQDTLYVEGGRTINLPARLDQIFQHNDYKSIENTINEHRTISLNSRLPQIIGLLYKDSKDIELKWLREQKEKSHIIEQVKLPETPLDKLCKLFTDIFPSILLEVDEKNEEIVAKQNDDIPYKLNSLSDGEKQCLALLCDILNQKRPVLFVVVDEPELNLHPKLAIKLWETIESIMPETKFVYTTHNIMFALRPNVDSVGILSKDNETKILIKEELYRYNDLDDFLGALPGILMFSKVILCEGEESSKFDELFYRWVIGNKDVGVFPVKNCHSVLNISKSISTLKDIIGTKIKTMGIVDGDGREDVASSYFRLPFDEVESYLCHPRVLSKITTKNYENIRTIVKNHINILFKKYEYRIIAKSIARKTIQNISVSIPRIELEQISSEEELLSLFQTKKSVQFDRIKSDYENDKIKKVINEINVSMKDMNEGTIDDDKIEKCLVFIPGKELLNSILTELSIKNKEQAVLKLSEVSNTDITVIQKLKTEICYRLEMK